MLASIISWERANKLGFGQASYPVGMHSYFIVIFHFCALFYCDLSLLCCLPHRLLKLLTSFVCLFGVTL